MLDKDSENNIMGVEIKEKSEPTWTMNPTRVMVMMVEYKKVMNCATCSCFSCFWLKQTQT